MVKRLGKRGLRQGGGEINLTVSKLQCRKYWIKSIRDMLSTGENGKETSFLTCILPLREKGGLVHGSV